jgi:hypothetical protein
MAEPNANPQLSTRSTRTSWLDTPLSPLFCSFWWFVSTTIFVGIVALLGGPSVIDTEQSVYGTWALAHGHAACAYPPVVYRGNPVIAPLYMLLSGGIAAVARIGHSVAFPSSTALGPGCDRAFTAVQPWSVHAGALRPTTWIGCIGWVGLLAGVVVWLRVTGKGRRVWEPVTLVVLACLPLVWVCVQLVFHPQDLLTMGLSLAAMACACRGKWVAAGVLVALAILSQQYALLVAVPLLVLAPMRRRIPFVVAAITTGVLIDIPFLAATSGHALRSLTLGTGDTPSIGGTVVWELHLHGAPLVLLSRVAPLAISFVFSWWIARRLGPAALAPATVLGVVAVSLALRLVFEQNIFVYYFMALAVCVVLLDVTRGTIRQATAAWLTAVVLVFCFVRGVSFESLGAGGYVHDLYPLAFLIPLVALALLFGSGGRRTQDLVCWLGVAVCALLTWPGHAPPFGLDTEAWFWQVVLVVTGIVLAGRPLLKQVGLEQARLDEEQQGLPTSEMVPVPD